MPDSVETCLETCGWKLKLQKCCFAVNRAVNQPPANAGFRVTPSSKSAVLLLHRLLQRLGKCGVSCLPGCLPGLFTLGQECPIPWIPPWILGLDTGYLFATCCHFLATSPKQKTGTGPVGGGAHRLLKTQDLVCRVLVLAVLQPGVAWAHALQIKRRIRWWPVLGRWWCVVLGLLLGLHSAALAGDVVGRQHSMRGQV